MESLFSELGLVVISAAVLGVITYMLRQPLILAYIGAGVLIGPFGLSLVHDIETIHVIAQVGIMLMLFLIGLEMNPSRLKDLGAVAFLVGLGQVAFTGAVSYLLALTFGFNSLVAGYLAVAMAMSSTVIAVKLIYDKHDNTSLYGQIAISILLVQDIVAILALLTLSGFADSGGAGFDYMHLVGLLAKGVIMTLLAVTLAGKLLGYLYQKIATSNELLILFSLGWAFVVALLAENFGFSVEIGAFLAGVSLAGLPYAFEINTKAKVIRDFFITIFFVALGAGMVFSSIGPLFWKLVILSLLVIIGNPIIVMLVMGPLGYDKRTSFFTGLAISNISEFSLILMAVGYGLGHISQEIVSMVTIIALITMTASSYMMTYNNFIYNKMKPLLQMLEHRSGKVRLSGKQKGLQSHIILLGCGQMGYQILDQIKTFKEDYLVVDHDNAAIKDLIDKGVSCIFGDIEDSELLQELDLEEAEIVISTLPGIDDNLFLIKEIGRMPREKRPIVIVTADSGREGLKLFNSGADYVILKPYLGAEHIYDISKQLYEIEEESGLADVLGGMAAEDQSKLRSDRDYAKLLHNLNKLRLAEIKEKIAKRHIQLERKGRKNKA